MNGVESCSVCGRTILAGEQTRTYLTPERERRIVCDLCRDRAERVGWVWEDIAPDQPASGGRRRAGLASLFGRTTRRREDAAEEALYPEPAEASAPAQPPPVGSGEPEGVPAAAVEPTPTTAPPPPVSRPSPDPAAPGAGIGRSPSPAASRMSRIESAIERFNNSEQSVMTAGLARTLGGPWVSVGTAAGLSSEVRITVAWELSWYQWGIDISDELRPPYEIGKGGELTELDGPAKQWNARMEDSGQIELGVVPIGRPAGGASGE